MTSMAGSEAIIFGGRIRARSGDGIAGANIEIVSRKTKTVLASSISIDGGSFRIRVLRESIDARERALNIRALSGNGELLVTRAVPVPADESVSDLVVPPEQLKNFRPAAQFLPRLSGSIMNPESLARIESSIRLIIPEGEVEFERLARVSRRALPPLARFDSVLEDSWDVLDGHLDAAQRLRRALTFLANNGHVDSTPTSVLPSVREGEFALRDLAQRAVPTRPLPDLDQNPFRPDICPAPTNRLVPIMAATLRIATGAEDAAMLLDALDTGLRGLNSFEFLAKLSETALSSGNTASFADELVRLTAEFGLDADGGFEDGMGWPFPPPGPPPPQPLEPCGRLVRECFGNLVEDWRLQVGIGGSSLGPVYRINSITPPDACPGETVVIDGLGFGGIAGKVVFPHRDGVSVIQVDPVAGTWTDTSISAVMPAEAGAGTIRLLIQDALVWTCAGPLPVYRQGTGGAFVGGVPFVSSVTINGQQTGAVVAPDSPFTVAWKASPNQRVSLFITEGPLRPKDVLFSNSSMPANGTITLRTSPRTSRSVLRAEVWSPRQRCGLASIVEAVATIDAPVSLKIEGVEVTQGIQIFSLQGARNTLSTVAEKDTIVRVYVAADAGGFNSPVTGVTGVLSIDATLQNPGTRLNPINGITPTTPGGANPFITARAVADIDRTQTNHTLNFRIPAALAKGTKTLTAIVWGPGPPTTRLFATTSIRWQWEDVPPLTVRFVRVLDATPTGTGTVPTEAEARYTLERALDLLPTSAKNIGPAWHNRHDLLGVTLPGLGGDMGRLVTDLRFLRAGPDPVTGTPDKAGWVALTPAVLSGPMSDGFATTVGSVSTAPIYADQDHQGPFRIAAGHEITHWLRGSCHTDNPTPCTGTPGLNPTGEVVFDPYWNEAVAPAFSYFNKRPTPASWIRPREWDLLRGDIIAWEGRP